MDYKIKELKKQIEPRENDIKEMKEQIQEVFSGQFIFIKDTECIHLRYETSNCVPFQKKEGGGGILQYIRRNINVPCVRE